MAHIYKMVRFLERKSGTYLKKRGTVGEMEWKGAEGNRFACLKLTTPLFKIMNKKKDHVSGSFIVVVGLRLLPLL
jgi:hypothetical protein